MYRDIPVFNRPVMEKIYKRNQEKHQQRLRSVKSNINSTSHASYSLSNKKALLSEQRRKTQIQKQNVELFNKVIRIMKRDDPNNKPRMSVSSQKPRTAAQYSRITQENRRKLTHHLDLYERLQHQKPTISTKKLMMQRMKNVNILKLMGKYPNKAANSYYEKFDKKSFNETQSQEIGHCDNCGGHYKIDEQQSQIAYKKYAQFHNQQNQNSMNHRTRLQSQKVNRTQAIFANKAFDNQQIEQQFPKTKFTQQKLENIPIEINNPKYNQNSITLFSEKINIEGLLMRVYIIRHYNEYQIKALPIDTSKNNKTYSVHIPEDEGNKFFVYYDYNYKKIVKMLSIEEGNLVIDDTKDEEIQEKKIEQKTQNRISQNKTPVNIVKQWGEYQQALQQSIQ